MLSQLLFQYKLRKISYFFLIYLFTGCSPIYITKAGYYQSRLLLSRQENNSFLSDPEVNNSIKHKIELTNEILKFAKDLGLNTEERYKTTSLFKFPSLWVATAAPEFDLKPYTWWFPVVGEVPYKGFFDKEDAEEEIQSLAKSGLDTSIRQASAFSSLGWFQDPLTSKLLDLDDYHFTNTIFHELFHSTIWVKNHAPFNETLANIFGSWAAIDFLQRSHPELLQQAKDSLIKDCEIAMTLKDAKQSLNLLYSSPLGIEEKRLQKEKIYSSLFAKLNKSTTKNSTPQSKSQLKVNNASFMSFFTYFEDYETLVAFYLQYKNSKGALSQLKENLQNKDDIATPIDIIKLNLQTNNVKESCSNLTAFLNSPS